VSPPPPSCLAYYGRGRETGGRNKAIEKLIPDDCLGCYVGGSLLEYTGAILGNEYVVERGIPVIGRRLADFVGRREKVAASSSYGTKNVGGARSTNTGRRTAE